jgi:Uma2 family endonuclease
MWSEVMKNGTALLQPDSATQKPRLDLLALRPGVPLRLTNVAWDDYSDFLEFIGDRYYRTSFADGEFEILMPTSMHGVWVALLGRLVQALTEELDLPIKSLDPTTLRREDLQKGLESDRCFYLENEALVRCKLTLDFNVDPPPDLAIEAEVASSVGRRMGIYAALCVPEVWRYSENGLIVNQLAESGVYAVAERSRFFPQVPTSELVRFMRLYGQMGERELMKSFREWVRQQIAAAWKG